MAELTDTTSDGFEEEQAPEDVRDFLVANDIGDKYQIILKERPREGGKALVLKTFTNNCPSIHEIGEQWGPGDYILAISWKAPGMNGKMAPQVKNMTLSLPERAWGELHEEYLERRRAARQERKNKEWQEEAQKARVFTANGAPGGSDLENLEKAINILSKFGIAPGGMPPPRGNTKSFGETLIELAPVITALTPLVLGLLKREGSDNNSQLLNTLVSNMLLQKPPTESESMKQMTNFLMGTMKQVLDMKEAMRPAEKESFVEKVFDKLVASGPLLTSVLKMSAEQRQNNFMVNRVRNSEEIQTLRTDPEAQAMMIARMDAYYGAEQTNQILQVMGFQRPPGAPAAEATGGGGEGGDDGEDGRDTVSGPAPMAGDGQGDGEDDLFGDS